MLALDKEFNLFQTYLNNFYKIEYHLRALKKLFMANEGEEVEGKTINEIFEHLSSLQAVTYPDVLQEAPLNLPEQVSCFKSFKKLDRLIPKLNNAKSNNLLTNDSVSQAQEQLKNLQDFFTTELKFDLNSSQIISIRKNLESLGELAPYTLPDIKLPIENYSTNITQKNFQGYVNALRNNDYPAFFEYREFISQKYKDIFHEVIGADDLLPLLEHELLSTDINEEDLFTINKLMMLHQADERFFADQTQYDLMNFFNMGTAVVSYKQKFSPEILQELTVQIKSKSGFKSYQQKMREIFNEQKLNQSEPDLMSSNVNEQTSKNLERKIIIYSEDDNISKLVALDYEGRKYIQERCASDNYFLNYILKKTADLYGPTSDYFFAELLKKVPIENVSEKIDEIFTGEKTIFNKKFLEYQIKNASKIEKWQIYLHVGVYINDQAQKIFEKNITALPKNYAEYLTWEEKSFPKTHHELKNDKGKTNETFETRHPVEYSLSAVNKAKAVLPPANDAKFNATIKKIYRGELSKTYLIMADKNKNDDLKDESMFYKSNMEYQKEMERFYAETIKPQLLDNEKRASLAWIKNKNHSQIALIKKTIHKDFISQLKTYIEQPDIWKVGGLFSRAKIEVNGKTIKVPFHVAEIYKLCLQAEKSEDSEKYFRQIIKIGSKASNTYSFFRKKETQQFYDSLKDAANETISPKK